MILATKTVQLPFGNAATFAYDDVQGPLAGVKTPIVPAKGPRGARRLAAAYVTARNAFMQEAADTFDVKITIHEAHVGIGGAMLKRAGEPIVFTPRRKS